MNGLFTTQLGEKDPRLEFSSTGIAEIGVKERFTFADSARERLIVVIKSNDLYRVPSVLLRLLPPEDPHRVR